MVFLMAVLAEGGMQWYLTRHSAVCWREAPLGLIVQRIGDEWEASYGGKAWRAAVGRNGIRPDKAEGDGVSPAGCWPIRKVLYRADKPGASPRSVFTTAAIDPQDGWCDAPEHPDYNRPVRLPFAAGREELWRQDDLYDIVVVLGHNDNPRWPSMTPPAASYPWASPPRRTIRRISTSARCRAT
ncbi:MAG: hypothetical protein JWQ65_3090 [Devosia sp.]|nr:hypothetical protein [Devosia sp.]